MKYPLFLSDFDGTLVRADGTISQGNIRAIAEYRRRGGIFAVVTGRMLRSIRPRLKELGLKDGLVVAYQGAMIADIATGALLKNDGFSAAAAEKVLRFLEGEDLHIHIYVDDVLYSNRDDEYLRMYEQVCGVKGIAVDEPLSAFAAHAKGPVNKVLAMVASEEKAALIARMKEALGEAYYVTASAEFLVEAVPAGVSKAGAVRFLAEHYGIPAARVAAIGDQLNDLPMILAAGGRFAVGNAQEELRRVAAVVSSCEEDGVAEALALAMGEEE